MAEKMFPLEDTEYLAEDAQLYFCTRSTGVYAASSFPVQSVDGMKIIIGKGIAWLKYSDFGGVVYANTTNKELTIGLSPAQNTRIDGICVKYDPITRTQSAMYVKEGTPSASPVPPTLTRDSTGYEIMLYAVTVAAGVTEITSADITDKRLDADVCGVMADSITSVDTSAINAQMETLLAQIEQSLQAIYDSVELASVTEFTGTLTVAGWVGDEAPYTQSVTCTGMLASDKPFVDVDMSSASTADELSALADAWANVLKATAAANAITVTAAEKPGSAVPIKIKVVR